MSSKSIFLAEIERFIADYGMSAKAFSRLAMGDDAFLIRLRRVDQGVRLDTVDRVRSCMTEYRRRHPLVGRSAAA